MRRYKSSSSPATLVDPQRQVAQMRAWQMGVESWVREAQYALSNVERGLSTGTTRPITIVQPGGTAQHGALQDLLLDHHTQYAHLAGRLYGQVLIGGLQLTDELHLSGDRSTTYPIRIDRADSGSALLRLGPVTSVVDTPFVVNTTTYDMALCKFYKDSAAIGEFTWTLISGTLPAFTFREVVDRPFFVTDLNSYRFFAFRLDGADPELIVRNTYSGTRNLKIAGATAPAAGATATPGETLTLDFATVAITGALTVTGSLPSHAHDTAAHGGDFLNPTQLQVWSDTAGEVPCTITGWTDHTADLLNIEDETAGNLLVRVAPTGGVDIEAPSGTEDVPLVVKGNAPSVQHLQQWYNNHPTSGSLVGYVTTTGALYVPNINIGYGTGQTLSLSAAPSTSSSVYFPDVEFADAAVLGKGTAPITPTPSNPQVAKLNAAGVTANTAWAYLTGYAPEGMYLVTCYVEVNTADAGSGADARIEFTHDGTTIVGTASVDTKVTTKPGQVTFSVFLAGGDGTKDIRWRAQGITGTVSLTVRARIVLIGA